MQVILATMCLAAMGASVHAASTCVVRSASTRTPVIELYTSEGCSDCPPADRWVSTLKDANAAGRAVVEAFHVSYWDQLGWVDRFASPAYNARQRQVAAWNHQTGVYTPQVVRDGRDWRDMARALDGSSPARAQITLESAEVGTYKASVQPADDVGAWAAYWSVTEHGHASKVQAGENTGELLRHDFVVRQYVPAGTRRGAAQLTLAAIAPTDGHPRQVNLVVYDPATGATLQAVSAGC